METIEKLMNFYTEFGYIKELYESKDANFIYRFLDYCDRIFPWLEENLEVYQIEVEDEVTSRKGIIGFGPYGEEIFREIPASGHWKYGYLMVLFDSPGLRCKWTELKGS